MPIQLEDLMYPQELEQLSVDSMSEEQKDVLLNWGTRMYSLGQHVVADIDDIKYDGRVIVLSDGSRWEVDAGDAFTASMWSPILDKVIVIDNEMFKLDDSEKVCVERED